MGTRTIGAWVDHVDRRKEEIVAYEFTNNRKFYASSEYPFANLDVIYGDNTIVTSDEIHSDIVTSDAGHDVILTSGYGDVEPVDPNAVTDGYGQAVKDGYDGDVLDGN
jgi:hypothetical protein